MILVRWLKQQEMKMDDKRLLRLAALAAGYKSFEYFETSGDEPGLYVHDNSVGFWMPLSDDGDALRLSVHLNIHIYQYGELTTTRASTDIYSYDVRADGDKYAATRRAIVRAAAAIGEQLEKLE